MVDAVQLTGAMLVVLLLLQRNWDVRDGEKVALAAQRESARDVEVLRQYVH